MRVYLTPGDAARILDVTPQTVRLMVERGELQPTATTESGIRLFERSAVETLATRRRRLGTARSPRP